MRVGRHLCYGGLVPIKGYSILVQLKAYIIKSPEISLKGDKSAYLPSPERLRAGLNILTFVCTRAGVWTRLELATSGHPRFFEQ